VIFFDDEKHVNKMGNAVSAAAAPSASSTPAASATAPSAATASCTAASSGRDGTSVASAAACTLQNREGEYQKENDWTELEG
jgi:hypothetical protein